MCLVTEGALVAHTAARVGLLLEGASLLGGEWAAPKLKGVLIPEALVPGRGGGDGAVSGARPPSTFAHSAMAAGFTLLGATPAVPRGIHRHLQKASGFVGVERKRDSGAIAGV